MHSRRAGGKGAGFRNGYKRFYLSDIHGPLLYINMHYQRNKIF
jgi:hypothetical protein